MNAVARKAGPAVWALLAALAASLGPGLSGPAAARDQHAGDFVFERLADQLGGRQSTVYDIFEDETGFVWFAGDTDGVLRFDGHELMSWTEGFHDNLTRSNVSTLRRTPDGRLWVGSWGNGLQYWDARAGRYVQFLADATDPHGLASNRVQRLMLDSSGRLWIGTTSGINLIEPGSPERLIRFAHDQPDHPLHDERIWGMAEHASGLWFATSGGVYRLSPDLSEWRHLALKESAQTAFERGAEVRTVKVAHDRVWAGSQFGAFVWDPESDRFVRVAFENGASHPVPRVNAMLESRQGGVWVGTHDGLYRIDEFRSTFIHQGDAFNLVPDVDIRALFEDREGNLWIGSRDQGILQGQRRDRVFARLAERAPADMAGQVARLTSAVLFDGAGRLWLGIPGGVLRQDSDGDWRQWSFDGIDSPTVRRIERIRQDQAGRTWIATDNGLFMIGEDDRLIHDTRVFDQVGTGVLAVNDFLVGADGSLWLALWNFGIVRWHPDTLALDETVGVSSLRDTRGDMIYQLAQASDGTIWASTRYAGVFRHAGEGWQALPVQVNGQQYPPSFYCAQPEAPDRLWLCTEDGLLLHDPGSGHSHRFGIEDGLPANRITGVHVDERSGLWVLTAQGVAWRAPASERFVSFGLRDGLPGLGMQRNAIAARPDGQLIMGSSHGAVALDPARASRALKAPRAVISRLWLDGVELTRQTDPDTLQLKLQPSNRDLTLQFAVLDFHEAERNLVRYRLRGFDSYSTGPTANLMVRYTNLPPGRYELELEGWSSRGIPTATPLVIPVRVAAPWWHSPWIWLAIFATLIALFLAMVQLRVHALRVNNERLQRLVSARTQELERANESLRVRSARDFLTGLLNRRGFTDQFGLLQHLSVRQRSALSLVLFDLDHFKRINDRLGHEAGDEVLKGMGQLLLETLRSQDLAARWGGEEFLLALPETDRDGAVRLCEKLRMRLMDHPFSFHGESIRVTATFGVVSGRAAEQPLEQWVKLADEAMYEGKRSGRDRIVAAPVDLV